MAIALSNTRYLNIRSCFKKLIYGFITEYETPKIVMVHSYTVTALLRVMQIILLFYSVFYLLLYEKGYQKQDTSIISSVTLKVKGIGYVRTDKNRTLVIDGADYIIPPSENNAIFIMTNFIQTDQIRSQCAESGILSQAICKNDTDCQNKPYMANANGHWTGRCFLSSERNISNRTKNTTKQPTGLCEIQGWCPVEDDRRASMLVKGILNFTIFVKNFIEFPTFNLKHKNMVENLKPCIFHPIKDKDCPIFCLDYVMNEVEKDGNEREKMLRDGAVIRVKLDWDCNLDRSIKLCKPIYSFARLDIPSKEEEFSIGFNFRYASHWKSDQTSLRSLKKAYGLRLILSVSGKAGKFDFITLTLNTGSLVGIFGLATFFCDIILLNLTRKAALYRDYIFERVRVRSPAHSASESLKVPSTIYANPTMQTEQQSTLYCTPVSNMKFLDKTDTHDSYVLFDQKKLSHIHPSNIDLSNISITNARNSKSS